jgi:peptidoglycan/xylan/chitin deacetylase (PgdA/CDA1 family)
MSLAASRFREIFGEDARVHGAAGWQMNVHAYRALQQLGMRYASDGRGTHPFMPVIRGEIVLCPQFPTTLPTLDEMIGVDGVDAANVAERLLAITAQDRRDHVYTLHAELEGMKLAPVFEKLLDGWREQGYQLGAMRDLVDLTDVAHLPLCNVVEAPVAGRSGTLATQGPPFLAGESSL